MTLYTVCSDIMLLTELYENVAERSVQYGLILELTLANTSHFLDSLEVRSSCIVM